MIENEVTGLRESLDREGKIVFPCHGISMKPLIRLKRDAVVIEKKTGQRFKRLDTVLFFREDGKFVLHRILKVYDWGYWIVGDNCFRGDKVTDEQILGVMTALKRGKRMIRPTDWHCRLYAHLWCDLYPLRFALLWIKSFIFRTLRFIKRKIFG